MIEDILYLKLITGEDIVSLVDSGDDEYLHLTDPIIIYNLNTQRGSMLRAAKWIPYINEDNFSIKHSHIVVKEKPSPQIEEYYFEVIDNLQSYRDIEDYTEEDYSDEELRAFYEMSANTDIKVH